jgi:hypothetical protein
LPPNQDKKIPQRHMGQCMGRAKEPQRMNLRGMTMLMVFVKSMPMTMEGFCSLRRSWFRPHGDISQDQLPLYLGFFECVHNAKKRGKALLRAL